MARLGKQVLTELDTEHRHILVILFPQSLDPPTGGASLLQRFACDPRLCTIRKSGVPMPPASLPQLALPLDDASDQPGKWDQKLLEAFANEEMTSGFLPLAEEALRIWPGNPRILCLAATAALLDRNAERALVFLKRYSKRYVPTATHRLLSALAAEQQTKPAVARAILDHYGLTSPFETL